MKKSILALVSVALALPLGARGQTYYYVDAAIGNDFRYDGTAPIPEPGFPFPGPAGPKATIKAAMDLASDGDVVIVAEGIYTGEGNRDIDFEGKAITVRSTDPNDPTVVAATVIDGEGNYNLCRQGPGVSEMHRAFVFHSGEGPNSVLTGFTIKRFCAPDEVILWDMPMPAGGGIFCEDSSPTITNCLITDNSAHRAGEGFGGNICCKGDCSPMIANCTISSAESYFAGGIYCPDGSPLITNCIITDNDAPMGPGGVWCGDGATVAYCTISNNYGSNGGICSDGTISYCTIENNTSIFLGGGGGIYGSPAVDHCIIRNNRTLPGPGGGVCFISGDGTISNSIIAGNSARSHDVMGEWYEGVGGGVYCQEGTPTITQCTITGNSAARRGGVHGDAIITDCILWDNTAPNEPTISGHPNVSYSDVEGGWPGVGNIAADPCFADANSGNYHLKSQAGRWDPNSQIWVQDDVTSPCIDAGDPMSPVGHEPFPNGGIVNMGAHGGSGQASKSYFGRPVCETIVAGDVNGDCAVNFLDFRLIALHWLE
jgi:hypothetical protein